MPRNVPHRIATDLRAWLMDHGATAFKRGGKKTAEHGAGEGGCVRHLHMVDELAADKPREDEAITERDEEINLRNGGR